MFFALLIMGASASQDSVIQKVVEMLQENKVKVVETLKQEEAEMAEYTVYCDDEITAKGYAIKDATMKMADLNAVIDDAFAQIKSLEDEIATLGTEMAGKDKEIAAATDVRKKERAGFEGVEKSMVSSIDALEKAIVLVKRGAGFLQVGGKPTSDSKQYAVALSKVLGPVIDAAWIDKGSAQMVKNFLQQHDNAGSKDEFSLKAHAKSKTHEGEGILVTLEDMKEKAQETLSSARMQEMKSNHNSQMMVQSLNDALTLSKSKLSDATATKAALTESSGKASGELAEVKKAKVADMFYLDNLKQECTLAAEEWADRQASAKGEIAAIDKAKEILTAKVKVLVQKDDPYESDDGPEATKRNALVQKLQTLGHKFSSYAMMEMAGAAAQDPLEKIKGLVQDMIAKLVEEANAEATQKDFCDEEKAKSQKEKDVKMMKADDLQSRIDTATAGKAKLGENIKELQSELAALDAATKDATKIRAEEAATFAVANKDYKDGAAAVEEAIRVLKEYYASQSFVQKKTSKAPISFGQTAGAAADTIISILETSAEDFSRMSTQLETDESEAIAAFEKLTKESKASAAAKKDEIKAAETEIKVLDVALQGDTEDLRMTHKELDAVMEYVEKLKPQCEVKIMTYEEKKAKRESEIEGLKEALQILDAPALVQTKKH
jgi:chromosome segregation ATPase